MDLVRGTIRILLPISLIGAIVLMAGGVIQNFHLNDQVVTTLGGVQRTITGGPVASQEAIKLIGSDGGGFYNANSSHPFENPTAWTNWIEIFLLLVISFSLPRTFGRIVGQQEAGLRDCRGDGCRSPLSAGQADDAVSVGASRYRPHGNGGRHRRHRAAFR